MPRKYTQKRKARVSRKSLMRKSRKGTKSKKGGKVKAKRGGGPFPARYFGMAGEKNFTANAGLTTAEALPKGFTWTGRLGGLPKC